jgi:hypothetical protein
MTSSDQQYVNAIVAALSGGAREEDWPEHLQLSDAVVELSLWIADDHQWGAPRSAQHWGGLIRDVIDALGDLGPQARVALDAYNVARELEACEAAFVSQPRVTHPALRERLAKTVKAITTQAQSPKALTATLSDLVTCGRDRDAGVAAAGTLLSFATWVGHDANWLVRRLHDALDGPDGQRVDGELVSPETAIPIKDRLAAAGAVVGAPPQRARLTVWLRLRPAAIRWPPCISIGDDVQLFRGDWLRSCLCAPSPHPDLPAEAAGEDVVALRDFCGLKPANVEAGGPPHDPTETPTAYIRVVVGEQFASRAVDIARSNAEAIAALGAVYGEEPTIWRLDRSYVVFSGTREVGFSIEAEEPEWTESLVAGEDRTGEIIRTLSERLAGHVPFRDDELERAMAMFGWLRGARSAPPAARLVLCDRVIEAVCGWAGLRNRDAFVREHLILWWALSRFEFLVTKVAHRLFRGYPSPRLPPNHPAWATWEEILNHEPLGLRKHPPRYKPNLLAAEVPWLLERVPLDTTLGEALTELASRIGTGADALSYWQSWRARGERIEGRRARTRNAIIHGGPLPPATVDRVVVFAESLASIALVASLDAKLAGKSIAVHFNDRKARLPDMRRRLTRPGPDDLPGHVLFGGM